MQGAGCRLQSETRSQRTDHTRAKRESRNGVRSVKGAESRDLVGHELADGGRELETVTRAGAHQVHAVVLRMPVKDEVLIWGVRVKADGGRRSRRSPGRTARRTRETVRARQVRPRAESRPRSTSRRCGAQRASSRGPGLAGRTTSGRRVPRAGRSAAPPGCIAVAAGVKQVLHGTSTTSGNPKSGTSVVIQPPAASTSRSASNCSPPAVRTMTPASTTSKPATAVSNRRNRRPARTRSRSADTARSGSSTPARGSKRPIAFSGGVSAGTRAATRHGTTPGRARRGARRWCVAADERTVHRTNHQAAGRLVSAYAIPPRARPRARGALHHRHVLRMLEVRFADDADRGRASSRAHAADGARRSRPRRPRSRQPARPWRRPSRRDPTTMTSNRCPGHPADHTGLAGRGVPLEGREGDMSLLWSYLRRYRKLVALALVLAAINQIFSLLDPLIFRHVIDSTRTRYEDYTTRAVLPRASAAAAGRPSAWRSSRASRRTSRTTSSTSSRSASARSSTPTASATRSRCPSQVFEDQRSGETLGKLQKVRDRRREVHRAFVNIVFTTLVGVVFVMVYAFNVHWAIAPAFLLTVPAARRPQLRAEQADQDRSRTSSSPRRPRWPARRRSRCATSSS